MTALVYRQAAFLKGYRAAGYTPIFVRAHHDADSNSPVWDRKYGDGGIPCAPGSTEAELLPELEVSDDEPVVTKYRYDSFFGTSLQSLLREYAIDTLLITGLVTSGCA